MIIDIIGFPGSGKSFLCEQITNDLKKKDIKTMNVLKFRRYTVLGKICNKIFFLIFCNSKEIRRLKNKMSLILKNELHLKSIFNKNRDMEFYIEYIALSIFYYNKIKNRKCIYIFDEGIYHLVCTLCMDYNLSIDLFYKLILFCKEEIGEINIIYNKISIYNCFKSIKKRNRRECQIDYLEDNEIYRMLNMYKIYFDSLEGYLKMLTIDREELDVNKIRKIRYLYRGI